MKPSELLKHYEAQERTTHKILIQELEELKAANAGALKIEAKQLQIIDSTDRFLALKKIQKLFKGEM